MSAKQDRQGARTASELVQRLNLGDRFAEVLGVATDARTTAEEAKSLIEAGMTQEEIFNILTNNGQSQGLYRGEDGELYINATYIKSGSLIADLIKSGVLQSVDGKTKLNLDNGEITCTDDDGNVIKMGNGKITVQKDETKLVEISHWDAGGSLVFYTPDGDVVGALSSLISHLYLSCGIITCPIINPGKKVLYSGNVTAGSTFTVPDTVNYDLFAVKLGTADTTEDTVVLAYKNGNTINGVGGWAGTASLSKELFFVSVTFDGDTWTLVDARKQGIYNAGSITSGTALNLKEVVGVI